MISIIVPVYNVEIYLQECLESIMNQTDPDFELILVDDGSTDGSGEICDQFSKRDARIHVSHIKNCGVSYARNVGIDKAEGEYIAFCDADDRYHPHYLENMKKAAQISGADIVICNYSYYCCGSKPVSKRCSGIIEKEEIYRRIFVDNTIGGYVWNKFFRREVIGTTRFDDWLQICEDKLFVCRILQKNITVYYLSDPLYFYRIRSESAVGDLRNVFNKVGESKYSIAYTQLINEKIIPQDFQKYVYADMCVLAIGVKCDYLNTNISHNKDTIRKLDITIKKNLLSFLKCPDYSIRKKVFYMADYFFHIRKIKDRIRKSIGKKVLDRKWEM